MVVNFVLNSLKIFFSSNTFSYDGTTLTTEASSTFPHGKTYALGNYKDSPFITGRDASSSGLKTEILNYQTSTWVEKDDYPFSSNRFVRRYLVLLNL